MKARLYRAGVWAGRLLLAGTFLAAALPKIADPGQFAQDVYNYQLLDETWSVRVAVMLPFIELLAAIAVLIPPMARGAALLLGGQLLFFITVLLSAIARGLNIDCGCFGADAAEQTSLWTVVWRDVGLLVAVGLAADPVLRPGPGDPPAR